MLGVIVGAVVGFLASVLVDQIGGGGMVFSSSWYVSIPFVISGIIAVKASGFGDFLNDLESEARRKSAAQKRENERIKQEEERKRKAEIIRQRITNNQGFELNIFPFLNLLTESEAADTDFRNRVIALRGKANELKL